eukprot:scaffold42902_cov65-Phaeocystis_antarctica.AAC.1
MDENFLLPLVTEDKAIEMLIALPPTPFAVKLSAAFSADIHLEVEVGGDFKALVRLVANGMGVTFDLGGRVPIVFSVGDWTQAITLELRFPNSEIALECVAKAATRGAGCGIQLVWECLLFHQPRDSEFKLIGQASLSAQFQVKLKVSTSFSICLGPVCGGVQANGFWDMAVGVDLALTTTTDGSNGLDADGVGCREW